MDETEKIPKPHFGGNRGEEFEHICQNLESDFQSYLSVIKSIKNTILDVKAPSWYDDIFR